MLNKLICLFIGHDRKYWTDDKCEEQGVLSGILTPWYCHRCDHESNKYPISAMPEYVKPPKDELDWISKIQILAIDDEDILIVKVPLGITQEGLRRLEDRIGKIIKNEVLFLDENMDLGMLRKSTITYQENSHIDDAVTEK